MTTRRSDAPPVDVAEVGAIVGRVVDEISRAVVGKRDVIELVLTALLADGHVLIEDVPGQAKTLLGRSLAGVCGLTFGRVQFTPDLVPSDVTGTTVPVGLTGGGGPEVAAGATTRFEPGPIFANLVLGDEINRAPPKTQAALLEAMQEGQVTVDGASHRLPRPFLVVATQNPIESDGTYPLPAAQLDRFMLKTDIGYPGELDEREVLRSRLDRGSDDHDLAPVCTLDDIADIQRLVETIAVDDDVVEYATSLVRATRDDAQVETGVSTRGALALVRASRARAVLEGRGFVVTDDLKRLAHPVLAHRIITTTEAWVRGVTADDVIDRALATVTVPESLTAADRAALDRTAGAPPGRPATS